VDLGDDDFDRIPDGRRENPRQAAGDDEICARVGAAVGGLPEKIRSAFILKHYEEMTYDEIAEVLGISPGTVKSRVNRAKEKLFEELKDDL
jgi:RNA polymerase sigma-70 factor (ECF subfamily)